MDQTYTRGTVTTGFGQVWTVKSNGFSTWAIDKDGVLLEDSDGRLIAAIITEMHRQEGRHKA